MQITSLLDKRKRVIASDDQTKPGKPRRKSPLSIWKARRQAAEAKSGVYAGEHGTVACTGDGEARLRTRLARTAYEWIANGLPLRRALERAVALLPAGTDIGLVGITKTETHVVNSRSVGEMGLSA